MFVSELFENIRMGYKDISRPSKKDYTFGVELEIIVSDDVFDFQKIKNDLIDQYSNGSDNVHIRNYISKLFADSWTNKFITIEGLVDQFELVSKAKKRNGAKLIYRNYKYFMLYKNSKKEIETYDRVAFIRSISFAYDFSELSSDKNYIKYLNDSITENMEKNSRSYISKAKIEYLEKAFDGILKIDRVELDSSVPMGGEVVSDVYYNLDEFLNDLYHAFMIINEDEYLSTDMTTGLHINIGTWNTNEIYNLDVLKFFLIADTMGILKDFDRVGSDYAVPVKDKLSKSINDLDITEYESLSKDITAKILGSADKFDDVNFSKLPYDGYIEVRGFGNADYEKRFKDIQTHLLKLIRVLDIAQDSNAYKNDYMKKLTKFLNTSTNEDTRFNPLQMAILNDFKKWGKPANVNAYTYDIETIEDMAKWIRELVSSSRSNSTYLKKLGDTIPPNLGINMLKYIQNNIKSGSKSFKFDYADSRNIIEYIIHEYYLEYESPKLEKFLTRIFKI